MKACCFPIGNYQNFEPDPNSEKGPPPPIFLRNKDFS